MPPIFSIINLQPLKPTIHSNFLWKHTAWKLPHHQYKINYLCIVHMLFSAKTNRFRRLRSTKNLILSLFFSPTLLSLFCFGYSATVKFFTSRVIWNSKEFFASCNFLIANYEISLRPVLQQPVLTQPQNYPNQPFANPNSISGQINGPFPQRVRSMHSEESINSSLLHFLKTMEKEFRDKHQRNGEKIDGVCEDRFFCDVALSGRLPKADSLHRMLYNVALEWVSICFRKSS